MHCTVRFHKAAINDIRRYRKRLSMSDLGSDLSALVDEQFKELGRLLARTGGHLAGARRVRPGDQEGVDGVFEIEYVSNKVWVEFSRERVGRAEILVSVLRWRQEPYST